MLVAAVSGVTPLSLCNQPAGEAVPVVPEGMALMQSQVRVAAASRAALPANHKAMLVAAVAASAGRTELLVLHRTAADVVAVAKEPLCQRMAKHRLAVAVVALASGAIKAVRVALASWWRAM